MRRGIGWSVAAFPGKAACCMPAPTRIPRQPCRLLLRKMLVVVRGFGLQPTAGRREHQISGSPGGAVQNAHLAGYCKADCFLLGHSLCVQVARPGPASSGFTAKTSHQKQETHPSQAAQPNSSPPLLYVPPRPLHRSTRRQDLLLQLLLPAPTLSTPVGMSA